MMRLVGINIWGYLRWVLPKCRFNYLWTLLRFELKQNMWGSLFLRWRVPICFEFLVDSLFYYNTFCKEEYSSCVWYWWSISFEGGITQINLIYHASNSTYRSAEYCVCVRRRGPGASSACAHCKRVMQTCIVSEAVSLQLGLLHSLSLVSLWLVLAAVTFLGWVSLTRLLPNPTFSCSGKLAATLAAMSFPLFRITVPSNFICFHQSGVEAGFLVPKSNWNGFCADLSRTTPLGVIGKMRFPERDREGEFGLPLKAGAEKGQQACALKLNTQVPEGSRSLSWVFWPFAQHARSLAHAIVQGIHNFFSSFTVLNARNFYTRTTFSFFVSLFYIFAIFFAFLLALFYLLEVFVLSALLPPQGPIGLTEEAARFVGAVLETSTDSNTKRLFFIILIFVFLCALSPRYFRTPHYSITSF